MKRLLLLGLAAVSLQLNAAAKTEKPAPRVEMTVPEIRDALQQHQFSIERLTRFYLDRIAAYDDAGPKINAVLALNPAALDQARALDRQRAQKTRPPLFGVPILLKDNIDTADLPTTAGSVALRDSRPPDDAFIVQRLRAAGAIVLGKATLTEWANFLAPNTPAGYSSLAGFSFNPYDPRPDSRSEAPFNDGRPVLPTGGSSSGPALAVNANLAAVAIGTETDGSILSPANANGVVGIKPTLGLVSRDGIIPITADQDTAGPITRTVTDAAIVLGVIAGHDPKDPATDVCLTKGRCLTDYTRFLDRKALRGARLAVYTPRTPLPANRQGLLDAAVADLEKQGATVRRLAAEDIPVQADSCTTYPLPAVPEPPAIPCSSVLLYGFRRDLDTYLANTPGAPRRNLQEVVAFNAEQVPPLKYGQGIAEAASQLDLAPESADTRRYQQDRARDLARSRDALNAIYYGPDGQPGTEDDTDAIIAVGNTFSTAPAKAGFPSVTVPGGFITAGPKDPPIAGPYPQTITFSGPAFSEPKLIALAYAYEQATQHRRPPASTPALTADGAKTKAP